MATMIDTNPCDGSSWYDDIRSSPDQSRLRVARTLHAGGQVAMAIALPHPGHGGHGEPPVALGPGQSRVTWPIKHWCSILQDMALSVEPSKGWHGAFHFHKIRTLSGNRLMLVLTDFGIAPLGYPSIDRFHQASTSINTDGMDQFVRRQSVDHSVAMVISLYAISVWQEALSIVLYHVWLCVGNQYVKLLISEVEEVEKPVPGKSSLIVTRKGKIIFLCTCILQSPAP